MQKWWDYLAIKKDILILLLLKWTGSASKGKSVVGALLGGRGISYAFNFISKEQEVITDNYLYG